MGWGGCRQPEPLVNRGNFHDRYVLGRKLGQGAFGQVRAVRNWVSDEPLVAKILDLRRKSRFSEDRFIDPGMKTAVKQEALLWRRIGFSPHCVQLCEVFADACGMVYLVMERCEGTMLDKLESMMVWTDLDVRNIFWEVLCGIAHIHSYSIVHRDIKPDNILFGLDKKFKICDFGLACRLTRPMPCMSGRASGTAGTVPYMSPEMLRRNNYDLGTDIWSYGILLYFVTFGYYPYGRAAQSAPEMRKAILDGHPPSYTVDPNCAELFKDEQVAAQGEFTRFILVRSAKQRPSAKAALHHHFIEECVNCVSSYTSEGSNHSFELSRFVQLARHNSRCFEHHSQDWNSSSKESDLDTLLERLQQQATAAGHEMRRAFSLPTDKAAAPLGLPTVTEGENEDHMSPQNSTKSARQVSRGMQRASTVGGEEMHRQTDFHPDRDFSSGLPVKLDLVTDFLDVLHEEWNDKAWSTFGNGDEGASLEPSPLPRLPPCNPSEWACRGARTLPRGGS